MNNTVIKPQRDSNIELLRILMMLVIIAHHYVVNSGIAPLVLFNGGGTTVEQFLPSASASAERWR